MLQYNYFNILPNLSQVGPFGTQLQIQLHGAEQLPDSAALPSFKMMAIKNELLRSKECNTIFQKNSNVVTQRHDSCDFTYIYIYTV